MIRKIVLFILIPITCFAQINKLSDPSIELPEFVITGIEHIILPVMTKSKAEFVSILSKDFIKPAYSPEELQISEISSPVRKEATFRDSMLIYSGRIRLGAGLQTIPSAEITFGKPFSSGIFWGKAWGDNERQYDKNAGIASAGLEMLTSFFIGNNSAFLPGAKIQIGGNYKLETFNFYKPDTLYFKRNSQFGNLQLNISSLMNENLMFEANLNDKIFNLKDRNLNENLFSLGGFLQTGFKEFSVASIVMYKNQSIRYDSLGKMNNSFIYLNPFVIINISNLIKIRGGFSYSHCSSNNLFTLYGFGAIRFNDKLSLYSELNPKASFLSVEDLSTINRYYNPGKQQYVFLKEKMNFKTAIKYEYEKYFEIDAGINFIDYDNYIYFTDDIRRGEFNLNTINARKISGFFNFLFQNGPYGLFYGNVILENIKSIVNNYFIPYSPSLRSTLAYAYKFKSGLRIDTKLFLASACYADLLNTRRVNEFADIGFKAEYEIFQDLKLFSEISNLINHKNYYWAGYLEKPFDIIFGIDYRW
jgi:hypothetical protein